MSKMLFDNLLQKKDGLIKGPFGGDIKKSLFVLKTDDAYKVYEQGVVLKNDVQFGDYYISKEHFEKSLKRFEVKSGDILMTGAGTLGKLFFVPEVHPKGVINQALLRIRLNESIVAPSFFKYYFKYYIEAIISRLNGDSVIPNLPPLPIIKSTEIDIPDVSTQKSIAKVLSDLDAKIELNNRINRELEAMAKTLYDYWFVQFDFPNEQGKPYKASGGKMVYNAELKRKIPEGWKVKTLAKWIKNDKSGDWGKETEEGNYQLKVSCVRGADLNGLNGNGELKSPTRFILENNSNKFLENHDLIVEISGGSPTQSTGRLAFITEETLQRFPNPLICSNFCKALTLKEEKYLYNFVYQWNRIYDNGVLFGWEGKTSGIKNLLFESFVTNHKEVYPKSEVVAKFYDFAKLIHVQKQKNLIQNQQLSELRDWLLPMLMNGQVIVKEAEESLSMAAEPSVEYKKG